MFALLSPTLWRILAVALVIAAITAAVWGFYRHAYNKGVAETTAVYEQALSKQKAEAAQLLFEEQGKVLVMERKLRAVVDKAKGERDALQAKNAADLRRLSATRLQFVADAGSGQSCPGTKDGTGTTTTDPSPTVIQLPGQIDADLRQLAADAQSILIDYATLYAYVNNPNLICELR